MGDKLKNNGWDPNNLGWQGVLGWTSLIVVLGLIGGVRGCTDGWAGMLGLPTQRELAIKECAARNKMDAAWTDAFFKKYNLPPNITGEEFLALGNQQAIQEYEAHAESQHAWLQNFGQKYNIPAAKVEEAWKKLCEGEL